MRVGYRGDGNQRAGAEEIPGRGNVIARLVPIVGNAQQIKVAGVKRRKDHRKNHPERQWRVQPRLHEASKAQARAPELNSPALAERYGSLAPGSAYRRPAHTAPDSARERSKGPWPAVG